MVQGQGPFGEHIAHRSFQHISISPEAISSCTEASPRPPQHLAHRQAVVGVGQSMVVVQGMARKQVVGEQSMEEGPSMAHKLEVATWAEEPCKARKRGPVGVQSMARKG